MTENLECPVCHKPTDYLQRYYDRHNIYSGRACSDKCAATLPGLGDMWEYDADEPIDDPDGPPRQEKWEIAEWWSQTSMEDM
jgi:hypothetical protein